MDELIELWEKPDVDELYMIAGWHQWADGGSISSGLPQYLINQTDAEKIGEIRSGGYYLFQFPGTHHFLRPEIKLEEGYRQEMETRRNEFFYAGDVAPGLIVFLGDEPHLNVERYAEAFLDAVEELGVWRVAAVGGVYGLMPYDKEREISCVYSLPDMQEELSRYSVKFSNYEGGSTIGTLLADRAEERGIEFLDFYAFVPAYDFSQLSTDIQGLQIENDFKAWYDLMRRLDHMFSLGLDLSDLEYRSEQVISSMDARIDELDMQAPDVDVRGYIEQLTDDFEETPFTPLTDMWERELGDLFSNGED